MDKLRARTVYAGEGLTVSTVESLSLQTGGASHRHFLVGRLEPIAVIVRQDDETYALDMGAQVIDIDSLNLPAGFF